VWQKNDTPNLERGWDLESATALVAVGPCQASPQGGDGGAVWRGPTGDALRFEKSTIHAPSAPVDFSSAICTRSNKLLHNSVLYVTI
jgi:hypothetical protein